ncbi:MAG: HTTM domain-containing protein [Candidatus Sericytochromatia bacterium]
MKTTAIEPRRDWLAEPICHASLAVFRIGFGLMMVLALIRFWARGWIAAYYITPAYHFTYPGLDWIRPWPGYGMYIHVAVLILAALAIALGWQYRCACLVFFLGFSWLELLDKTPYLNHYYAICVFSLWLLVLPLDSGWSLKHPGLTQVPRWQLSLLQAQLAIIYCYAGLAKINPDWLLRAEPLHRWLQSEGHLPLLGPWLLWPPTAWIMAWAGMLFDLSIPLWLSWSKTRLPAYLLLLVFHGLTAWLFPIGVFPWLMILATLLFFPPDWPLRFLPRAQAGSLQHASAWPRGLLYPSFLAGYLALQLLLPLRHLLYPGPVMWNEEGFRFSWRVMVMEKTGWVEFNLKDPRTRRQWHILPHDYLTPFQVKMMSTQPDMIQQFAHYLGGQWRQRGYAEVEVYAEAYAALNGRPSQYLIDPQANLLAWPINWAHKPFITPLQAL